MGENITKKKSKDILKFLGFRNRKSFIVFLIFVLIAFVFWFLIALSKEYTTVIDYPVKYISFPKDKILIQELPDDFQLQITGNGFDLLKYEFSGFIFPYIIDYEKISNHSQSNRFSFQTNELINDLRRKFPSNVKLQDIFPKTIIFSFSSMVEKEIPVEADIVYRLARQYIVSDDIVISPDYVIAKGPKAIIDTMTVAKTEKYDLKILDEPVKKKLSLKEVKLVTFSKDKVLLFINVQKFTEATINIPVVMKGLPDTLSVNFVPDKISVKYKVALNHFNEILPEQFKAVANYSSVVNSKDSKIPVYLEHKPKKVFDVSFSPKRISFLFSKKENADD